MKKDLREIPIIDCDIHPEQSEETPLEPFIPNYARPAVDQGQAGQPGHGYANPFGVIRRDASCDSLHELQEQHLDRYKIVYGLLQPPGLSVSLIHNLDLANALAQAWNDWQVENYLEGDERVLGSICINMNDPPAAVEEIRRCAAHPRMVTVLVTGESMRLYGHRQYFPIYEACQENEVVFSVHPGFEGSLHASTPVGRPSNYFEWHNALPLTFQAHLISMVGEGVFEKFRGLKVLLVEGGISWLPGLMWRMDKNFKALRSLVPWLRQAPSAYVKDHVRLTTQPIEEPNPRSHLLSIFEMIEADKTVCFASDFPHWDNDHPFRALPPNIPIELVERIFYKTACELFGLKVSEVVASEAAGGSAN